MQKCCKQCRELKEATEEFFWKNDRNLDGFNSVCKICRKKSQRLVRLANPEKHKDAIRKYTYGIEGSTYRWMAKAQNNSCAICGSTPTTLGVDHDHTTNEIRGLLCDQCNFGLGNFKDNPELLLTAAAYLMTDRQFDPRNVVVLPFVEEILKGQAVTV